MDNKRKLEKIQSEIKSKQEEKEKYEKKLEQLQNQEKKLKRQANIEELKKRNHRFIVKRCNLRKLYRGSK